MVDTPMPLTSHLAELRGRLFVCVIAIGFAVYYALSDHITTALQSPPRQHKGFFASSRDCLGRHLRVRILGWQSVRERLSATDAFGSSPRPGRTARFISPSALERKPQKTRWAHMRLTEEMRI
jgi:hypothetical protein